MKIMKEPCASFQPWCWFLNISGTISGNGDSLLITSHYSTVLWLRVPMVMFTINHRHINQLLWWQLALGFYTSSTSKPKPLSGWSFQPIPKKIYCSQFEPSLQIGVKQHVWNQFHQQISRYVQCHSHTSSNIHFYPVLYFFYMPIDWWIPHLWLPISILPMVSTSVLFWRPRAEEPLSSWRPRGKLCCRRSGFGRPIWSPWPRVFKKSAAKIAGKSLGKEGISVGLKSLQCMAFTEPYQKSLLLDVSN